MRCSPDAYDKVFRKRTSRYALGLDGSGLRCSGTFERLGFSVVIATDYLAAAIRMWLSTDVTPFTARAIETALSSALWLGAVPLSTTMPLLVSTLMSTRVDSFVSAILVLTWVVITESLTKAVGDELSESAA